ncbi:glutamate--tRNA ligase, partial [Arthrobacter sp. Bz4]|uniref:glutamate--tRNA ligase n=1 Tax=Arthrobacter sp. Bz4 TaxID=2171979 RepID=UPI000D50B0BC
QSQRSDLYQDVIAKLRAAGHLYESFSTPEEVEERHRAAGRDVKLGYDNYDRTLTEDQQEAFRCEGRGAVLRLRMPDDDITFTDLVRGEITFRAGSIPDFAVVRANGAPLYTLVNPVDDALMGITHVLRGEDLLSSTPRQIALYRALIDIGVASYMPLFGHLPYVMGQGNKKLSKRDPESNLFLHRERGFIPEGLLNYLSLLGWSLSADEDIFTVDTLVEKFDVHDVLANPARFDLKKAEAINGTHVRLLEAEDFRQRIIPYLQGAGFLGETLSDRERQILIGAAPLIQERITLLREAPDMLGFLFTADAGIEIADDARKGLPANLGEVLDAAQAALQPLDDWTTETIQDALRQALVEELGMKPRLAFGPVRTAVSGKRISPPLFESMVILGKESSLARIAAFRSVAG